MTNGFRLYIFDCSAALPVRAPLPLTVPQSFSLSPPFPNPFNGSTKLQFSLPYSEWVSLKIFDLQGREVTRLFDAQLPEGEHCYFWDASSFVSGIYLVRLLVGGESLAKKVVVLK